MLLNLGPESPAFGQSFHSADSLDRYTSDMEAMSVSTDDQSVSDNPLDMAGQHDRSQFPAAGDGGLTPKKKRIRKTRAKVKSPELIQKLKTSRRQRANDRERNRMHGLNEALEVLRTTLPNSTDAKMTKIETLRYACNYISALAASVKLLEQSKDKHDFCNELPNPDDYAFMLNFQYGGESMQDSDSSSPVARSHNNFTPDPSSFHPQSHLCGGQSQQQQQQPHADGGLLPFAQAQHAAQGVRGMDTPTSGTESFLFPEQAAYSHMGARHTSQPHHVMDHQPHRHHEHPHPGVPFGQFSCFLENQAKNRMDMKLGSSAGSAAAETFFDNIFPQHNNKPQMTPSAPFNTPPTSPDVRAIPQPSRQGMPAPGGYAVQHNDHHFALTPSNSQPYSSPIMPRQFL